jgi:ATP-dependent RNA helicase RhlE
MHRFRKGLDDILVATELAARGIDVPQVGHVINYDVPQHPEDYVHRIGRTGRAQAVGDAFTIMVAEDLEHIQSIERFIGQQLPRVKIDNFPYLFTRAFEAKEPMRGRPVRAGSSFSTSGFGRRRR